MSDYSKKEQTYMLSLARQAIVSAFHHTDVTPSDIPLTLHKKRACFITLTIHHILRGCIGHIYPVQELWHDIIDNARAAAFDDPRFPPLLEKELEDVSIEVSVLSTPQPLVYSTVEGLLMFLKKHKPGIILSKGPHHATFLPQVWKDMPNPKEFLTHLCLKANLDPNAWLHGVVMSYYTVENMTDEYYQSRPPRSS